MKEEQPTLALGRITLALGVAWLAACVHADPMAPIGPGRADVLVRGESGFELQRDGQRVEAFDAGAPLGAVAAAGTLVVWQLDDSDRLWFARTDTRVLAPVSVDAGMEADALCIAPLADHVYDLFLADGDGRLLHAWLLTDSEPRLQPVRVLATNPDVSQCHVDAERVHFLNPPMGIASYARNPETDPEMAITYAPGPAGAGVIEPAAFRIDSQGGRLMLWDDAGQAYTVAESEPGRAAEIDADPDRQPFGWQTEAPPRGTARRVLPSAQTDPVPNAGDAADDAVVIQSASGETWVVGTNKRLGLHVYDLEGRQRHVIQRGRVNNVDALAVDGGRHLLAASNRTHGTLDLYMADIAADRIAFITALPVDLDDPYGLCMGRLPEGSAAVFIGGKDGEKQIWQVADDGSNGTLRERIRFDSQTEGCVYDQTTRRLYVGEEAAGIWELDLETGGRRAFDTIERGLLVADVEGLDIYRGETGAWLVASSQGDDSFVLYSLDGQTKPVKFEVAADPRRSIDGVSETDGLAVLNRSAPGYPRGMLVVQDGRNRAPAANQNFKIVDWREIEALLQPAAELELSPPRSRPE